MSEAQMKLRNLETRIAMAVCDVRSTGPTRAEVDTCERLRRQLRLTFDAINSKWRTYTEVAQ